MKKVRRNVNADEGSSAVDVFGGTEMSQEDLLASALGETSAPAPAPVKPKKKKKGKKLTGESDDNAVDVFGMAGASQDQLLADALGSKFSDDAPPAVKSKKKGRKASSTPADNNAVEVFGDASISQEQLLADSLGSDEAPPSKSRTSSKKGKKKKGKKGAIISDDENAVDVFGAEGMSEEQSSSSAPVQEGLSDGVDRETSSTPAILDGKNDIGSDTEVSDGAGTIDEGDDVLDETIEDDFEPEAEIVDEFKNFTEQISAFTSAGRREKRKASREDGVVREGRLADPRFANFGSGGEKYTSVRLEDVTVTFRNTTILSGVTWDVKTGDRVGLVGENGCGKTTQLRIIAGLLEPTSGEVTKSSSKTKSSFLRQEFVDELDPSRTLREEFMAAFEEEGKLLMEYKECEQDIASAGEDMGKMEELLNRMEDLRQKCEEKDAWNLDARIDKVLPGLGFVEEDNDKLVASFSGGWKVRIGLGKVLLQDPDLLLLDEPSNHLDTESVEWLEQYLQTCKLPMVVVSHDREFLDRVCTKIVDIEGGEAFEYPGNYSTYVKLKKEQRKAWESAYDRQQKFIKEQENYIKRNKRSAARAAQAKSRQKMLERMRRTGQIVQQPPRRGKPLVFRFPPAPRSGRDCIVVENLDHGYEGRTLFRDASIAIERGDRIALIGPNGCGKSTLLRMITGREQPQGGTVECQGLSNISLAYYEQNQADALDLEITVLDTLKMSAPVDMRYEEVRALLGKFLFKGDAVEKQVGSLSGGEKARLALAKIMMEPANVLVLDEPGNHLSISAKEMLEEALQHFEGTLLLVSHDRYLISQVATQIVAVEDQELVLYDGDYKSYMERNQDLKARLQARFIPGIAEIKSAPKVVLEEPIASVEKKQKRKKNFGGSGINSGKTKEMNAKRWNK